MYSTKYCSKCKKILDISMFGKNRARYNGLKVYCRKCANIIAKNYYDNNIEKRQKSQKKHAHKRYKEFIPLIHNLKINGCAICGYSKCDAALDFHHANPQDKKFSVNMSVYMYNNETITNELSKCILLCKNCHTEVEHDCN